MHHPAEFLLEQLPTPFALQLTVLDGSPEGPRRTFEHLHLVSLTLAICLMRSHLASHVPSTIPAQALALAKSINLYAPVLLE